MWLRLRLQLRDDICRVHCVFHFSSNLLICSNVIKANSIFPAVFLGPPKTGVGSLNPHDRILELLRRRNKYFIHILPIIYFKQRTRRDAMWCAAMRCAAAPALLAAPSQNYWPAHHPSSRNEMNGPAKSRKKKTEKTVRFWVVCLFKCYLNISVRKKKDSSDSLLLLAMMVPQPQQNIFHSNQRAAKHIIPFDILPFARWTFRFAQKIAFKRLLCAFYLQPILFCPNARSVMQK